MKKLSVVGCGTVGSSLLKLFASRSLETKCKFEILEFIDPDVITEDGHNKIGYPKTYQLEDQLYHINPLLRLRPVNNKYPDFIREFTNTEINNTAYIDCRDNKNQSDFFYMKISSDGPYGNIIKYPTNNDINEPHNYSIKNSEYYSLLTVSHILEDIINIKFPIVRGQETQIVLNHLMSSI